MTTQPLQPADKRETAEARSWTRFPPDTTETSIVIDGERLPATILNESFGGVGMTIGISDAVELQVGKPLIVLQHDYPTPGRIQWFQRNTQANHIRLGISWSP